MFLILHVTKFFQSDFCKNFNFNSKTIFGFCYKLWHWKKLVTLYFPWFHETISANLNVYVIKFISYNTPTKALIKLKEAILNKKKTSISITYEITDELT